MIAMNQNALSPRALDVLTRFNLSPRDARLNHNPAKPDSLAARDLARQLAPGTITLIAGPSGSGKTTLLRALESQMLHRPTDVSRSLGPNRVTVATRSSAPASGGRKSPLGAHSSVTAPLVRLPVVDLGAIHLPGARVIDCLDPLPVEEALEWLARFGLGEVWCYLSPASRLSAGQRFRLRLAIAVHRATQIAARHGGAIVLADEFANSLDRITARLVSRNLRRALTGSPIAALLATAHEDLEPALAPDSIIHCDFGAWQCHRAQTA